MLAPLVTYKVLRSVSEPVTVPVAAIFTATVVFANKSIKSAIIVTTDKVYLNHDKKLKFDETLDIAINLGVDPKHADQIVKGVVKLPHGTCLLYTSPSPRDS